MPRFSRLVVLFCCLSQQKLLGKYFGVKKLENVSLNSAEQITGAHSQIECIMKCQRKFPGEKNAFYTNDGKCFCVSEVSESKVGDCVTNGNLFSEVFDFIVITLENSKKFNLRSYSREFCF